MDNTRNLQDLGQTLRQRRNELGITLDALAQTTGISKPYLSNIETARAPGPPSAEKLVRIATALQLDGCKLLQQADWLRTPVSIRNLLSAEPPRRADGSINLDVVLGAWGDKVSPTGTAPTRSRKHVPDGPELRAVPLARIPLINRVAAGKASEYTDLDYPVGVADAYIPVPALPPDSIATADAAIGPAASTDMGMFALRITGDSMEPLYHHGDIVVFSAGETPRDGDDCLVRLDAGDNFSTTFKRVYFPAGETAATTDQVRLVPLNSAHLERRIARERISGIYPALWRVSPAPRAKDAGGVTRKHRAKRPPPAENSPQSAASPRTEGSAASPAPATSRVAIEFD